MKRVLVAAGIVALFVVTFTIRTWGISQHFWMLEDQWRDWEVALLPLRDLPLVGSPTHVHGYTIGPAFYWILWAIRVTMGPFFDNLPHAGGIGQALLETAADIFLMLAVWRRTGSPWIAVAGFLLMASSAFDLSLAALVWNPTMGETLIKAALALVLFGWYRRSLWVLAVTAAIAWAAVHAYTGAVFAALATLALLAFSTDRRVLVRRAIVVAGVVALLQMPYVIYRYKNRNAPVMSAVSGGVSDILQGKAAPDFYGSARFYATAAGYFQNVNTLRWAGWILILSTGALIVRYRQDPELLWMLLAPPALAILGYALFLGTLDVYYYLSLLPISVLTVVIGLMPRSGRAATAVGAAVVLGALSLVPWRMAHSHTFEMPEYAVLVSSSRTLLGLHQPLRDIRTSFPLPPTTNVGHPYVAMGGVFDRNSLLVATINLDGSITYNIPLR
jgi:hypothetical protein